MSSQGWLWACGSRPCQLCHSVSPWRCHLKGKKKSLFRKTTDKNSTSYSAHPFPVHTQNSFADCNHRNKDLGALGWAGVQLCHQPNHVELLAVPPPQTLWQQQGRSIGAEGHVWPSGPVLSVLTHSKKRKFSFPMPRAIFRVVCWRREVSSLLHRWSGFERPWNYICMVTASPWILSSP